MIEMFLKVRFVEHAMKDRITSRKLFYGWYIVASSVAVNFYIAVVFGLGFNVFFLPILREFGWTRALTSGAFALRSLESGLVAPLIGFLVDRWGSRNVILSGVILVGLGMILMGFITSLWTFYVAFLVASLGASGAGHGVSWMVVVSKWFNRLRGRALGMATLGPVIGGPCLFIMAVMEATFGWRVASVVLGLGVWVLCMPLAMVVRDSPDQSGYGPDGDIDKPVKSHGSTEIDVRPDMSVGSMTVAEAVATRDFWFITILFSLMFMGISGLMVHFIPLLEDLNYSSAQAASMFGFMFLFSGIGRISSGFLADVFDYRMVLAGLVGLQIIGLGILSFTDASKISLVILSTLIFGIGFGGTIPLRPYIIIRIFGPNSFGSLQGLLQMGAIGAGAFGPVFYGWTFDTWGSYDVAIYVTLVTIVMTLPFVIMLRRSAKS